MEKLRKNGWNLNENVVKNFFDDEIIPTNEKTITETLLNEDLKEFGEPSIVNLTDKEKQIFVGPCILQLTRYRNVCLPKVREEFGNSDQSSAIIRIFMTDGHNSISAIILNSIPGINHDTPPGTKIQLSGNIPMEGIFLILTKANTTVIGGRVEKLIEKWNVERNLIRSEGRSGAKSKSATGAPKWVSFGKKTIGKGPEKRVERNFKANDAIQTNKKIEECDDEFTKNREQTLNELKSSDNEKQKKVFAKPNVNLPIKTIPESRQPTIKEQTARPPKKEKPKRRGRGGSSEDDDDGSSIGLRPSAAPTLFDFMSDVVGEPTNNQSHHRQELIQKSENHNHQKCQNPPRSGGYQSENQNQYQQRQNQNRYKGHQSEREKQNQYQKNQNHSKFSRPEERNHQNQQRPRPNASRTGGRNERHVEQLQTDFERVAISSEGRRGGPKFTQRETGNERKEGNAQRQDRPKKSQNFGRNERSAQSFSIQTHPTPPPKQTSTSGPNWRVGTKCLAPWDDGQIYPATIVEMYPNRICAIRYDDYGNVATIPVDVLIIS